MRHWGWIGSQRQQSLRNLNSGFCVSLALSRSAMRAAALVYLLRIARHYSHSFILCEMAFYLEKHNCRQKGHHGKWKPGRRGGGLLCLGSRITFNYCDSCEMDENEKRSRKHEHKRCALHVDCAQHTHTRVYPINNLAHINMFSVHAAHACRAARIKIFAANAATMAVVAYTFMYMFIRARANSVHGHVQLLLSLLMMPNSSSELSLNACGFNWITISLRCDPNFRDGRRKFRPNTPNAQPHVHVIRNLIFSSANRIH